MLISNILQNYKIVHLFRFLWVWDMEKKSSSTESYETVQQFYIGVSLKHPLIDFLLGVLEYCKIALLHFCVFLLLLSNWSHVAVEDVQYLSSPLTGNGTLRDMRRIRVSEWGMCLPSWKKCSLQLGIAHCLHTKGENPVPSVFFLLKPKILEVLCLGNCLSKQCLRQGPAEASFLDV